MKKTNPVTQLFPFCFSQQIMPSAPRRTQTQPFDSPPAAAAKQAGRTQKKGKGLDAEIITSSAVSAFLKMLPTSTSWYGRPRGA